MGAGVSTGNEELDRVYRGYESANLVRRDVQKQFEAIKQQEDIHVDAYNNAKAGELLHKKIAAEATAKADRAERNLIHWKSVVEVNDSKDFHKKKKEKEKKKDPKKEAKRTKWKQATAKSKLNDKKLEHLRAKAKGALEVVRQAAQDEVEHLHEAHTVSFHRKKAQLELDRQQANEDAANLARSEVLCRPSTEVDAHLVPRIPLSVPAPTSRADGLKILAQVGR
jgi:hypothetical protein